MPDAPRRTWIKWNPQAGRMIKWKDQAPGFVLEGTWLGLTEGDYGPLGQIEEPGKDVVKFPLPASLKDRMTMPRGTYIRLEYTGKGVSQRTQKEYYTFEVFSDAATMPELAAVPPDTATEVLF